MKAASVEILISMLFALVAAADPQSSAPAVHNEILRPRNAQAIPTVRSPEVNPNNGHGVPEVKSPQFSSPVKKIIPQIRASGSDPTGRKVPVVKPVNQACQLSYGQLLRTDRSNLKKILAAAAALQAAGAGGYAYSQYTPPPAAPLPEKDKAQKQVELAQNYLSTRYQKYFGQMRAGKFPMGHWLLESENIDHGSELAPESLAVATKAYDDLLAKTEAIKKSKKPFLEKIQAVRDLALTDPGVLVGYCADSSTLEGVLLNHCGNCEASTKTFLSLLHDSDFPIEKPYQLGAQVYSDHIQPVLVDVKGEKVLDLDSGTPANHFDSNIYGPDLLLFGYLKGKHADTIVNRNKDLLLAAQNFDNHIEGTRPKTDSKSNYGGASSGKSNEDPPAFASRQNSPLGTKPSANATDFFSGHGSKIDACDMPAIYQPGDTVMTYQTGYMATAGKQTFSFNDPGLANRWNSADPSEKLTVLKEAAEKNSNTLAQSPNFDAAMAALTSLTKTGTSPPKGDPALAVVRWQAATEDMQMAAEYLRNCLNDRGVKIDTVDIVKQLLNDKTAAQLRETNHRAAADIADDPVKFLAKYKALPEKEQAKLLALLRAISATSPDFIVAPGPHKPIFGANESFSGFPEIFRTAKGNTYSVLKPLGGIMPMLNDRRKVDVGEETNEKSVPRKPSDVDLPTTNLPVGDHGFVVVLPPDEKTKQTKQAEVMMSAKTMAALLSESMKGYTKNSANADPFFTAGAVAGRLTEDVAKEYSALNLNTAPSTYGTGYGKGFSGYGSAGNPGMYPQTTNANGAFGGGMFGAMNSNSNLMLDSSQNSSPIAFDTIETLKSISAFRPLLGGSRKVFNVTAASGTGINGCAVGYHQEGKTCMPDANAVSGSTTIAGLRVAENSKLTELKIIDEPAKLIKADEMTLKGAISFTLSGQTFTMFTSNNQAGGIAINLAGIAGWICDQKCSGPVSLSGFLNDPKMKAVKDEILKSATPGEKLKYESWGVK